jgi:hypothetical protein
MIDVLSQTEGNVVSAVILDLKVWKKSTLKGVNIRESMGEI